MRTATISNGTITIRWQEPPAVWRETLELVKTVPGRRFHPESKTWSASESEPALAILQQAGFEIVGLSAEASTPTLTDSAPVLDHFPAAGKLHQYQRQGIGWLLGRDRALLADDMGLGKTAQVIYTLAVRNNWPACIVVPASLKLNWQRELWQWAGLSGTIISGKTPVHDYGKITIINYDILEAHMPELRKQGYKTVVLEESHALKNQKAKRTKAAQALCKGVPRVIAISGTPIVNRPSEFFTVLNILDRYRFPAFWHFAQRFCGARHNGFGWDFSGSSNTEELRALLIPDLMLRRRKTDVLTELPAKTRAIVPLLHTEQDAYQQARRELIEALGGEDRAAALVMVGKLRQIAARAKMPEALAWIQGVLDSGEKLVVFAVHHFVIDAVMAAFPGIAVKLDGRDGIAEREASVQRFQTDDSVRLFVGNIKASGVGITLTAASNVAFLELPWSPGDLEQAIDRCHRIGQQDAVTAWVLVAQGTIEEEMAALLDSKAEQLAAVMDGTAPGMDTLLTELLRKYRENVDNL